MKRAKCPTTVTPYANCQASWGLPTLYLPGLSFPSGSSDGHCRTKGLAAPTLHTQMSPPALGALLTIQESRDWDASARQPPSQVLVMCLHGASGNSCRWQSDPGCVPFVKSHAARHDRVPAQQYVVPQHRQACVHRNRGPQSLGACSTLLPPAAPEPPAGWAWVPQPQVNWC